MQTIHLTVRTQPIQLSGAFVYESLHTAENNTSVRTMRVVYDEATSSNPGVEIRIGKIGNAGFFAVFTSEISKAAGESTYLPKTDNILLPGETLTVECAGGKVGTGVASVQIELNHDLIL